ncbi:MAG: hypothetical protein U0Y68_13145 [Blastocatellia bacterium]
MPNPIIIRFRQISANKPEKSKDQNNRIQQENFLKPGAECAKIVRLNYCGQSP